MKHYRITVDLSTPEDLELAGPQQFLAEVDEKAFRLSRPSDGDEEQIEDFIKRLAWVFLFERGILPIGLSPQSARGTNCCLRATRTGLGT